MTLHDIQSSLDELRKRHPGITEEMVGVLLAAGGWEKKAIEEAQLLFRSQSVANALPHEDDTFLPSLEEKLIDAPKEIPEARESLVVTEVPPRVASSIPDNLPLRPFETSPHVWSFSKYKDVFHADTNSQEIPQEISSRPTEEITPPASPPLEAAVPEPEPAPPVAEVSALEPVQAAPAVVIHKVPLAKKDEAMIAFGAALLLAAVLLILYMFNNGRL